MDVLFSGLTRNKCCDSSNRFEHDFGNHWLRVETLKPNWDSKKLNYKKY